MSSSTHKINHACILVEKSALQQFLDIFFGRKTAMVSVQYVSDFIVS